MPVREGSGISEALAEAARLAAAAEAAGYKRFWVAEHHATAGIAGGAVSVVLAHIGHTTSTIRIGAGGIMLPNHNPFVIAAAPESAAAVSARAYLAQLGEAKEGR